MKSDNARLSILHVSAPAAVGGMERVVQTLAIGHHQMGHRVGVAAIIDVGQRNHPFLDPLIEANVDVFPMPLPRRAYLTERRLVAELCRHFRPDVIHTHGFRPDVLDADVARRLGLPTITTVHGPSRMGGMARLYEFLQRKVLRTFDAVVAVSRPIAEGVRRDGVPENRIHVVPNACPESIGGLDRRAARRVLGLPGDGFVVGWVGRLIPAKGADVFLRALAMLNDFPLLASIVGDGIERPGLEAHARSIGLNGRITFHGSLENAAQVFPAFDLFMLSSRTEGTPIVLLEAMGAGVPIVATRVGGVPDLISDVEAYLVPPEDPVALAAAMRSVYNDPHGAKKRARAARRRLAADYAVGPWLSRYEEIYRRFQRPHQEQRE